MLQLTPHHRVYLAIQPVDFRKGIDKLVGVCREQLLQDPFTGNLFVFTNRRRSALKILVYDGQGFWLCLKRLSQGKLSWWPNPGTHTCTLSSAELSILLYNGNPKAAQLSPDWRPLLPKD